MIRLKNILNEQAPNPKAIAKTIFDAKGYTYDDEQAAIRAVLSINSYQQYKLVEKYFINLSGGRSIPEYLVSFLEDFRQNLKVIKHLYSMFKSDAIAMQSVIYPYASQLIYEYSLDIAKTGVAIRKQQGNTAPITLKNYGESVLWFKPYLGDENYNRWVSIKQSGKYDRAFNSNAEEEQYLYGASKAVSSGLIIMGQLMIGALATAATAGGASPIIAGWIGAGAATSIGWADAVQEWNLGNKTTAGILAVIELLPIVSKIPAVKQLVKSAGKSVAKKLAKGVTKFTGEEQVLVRELFLNKDKLAKKLQKIKGNLPDKSTLERDPITFQSAHKVPGSPGAAIGVYGKTKGRKDVWVAMADKYFTEFKNYVTYQRVFINGKATNELSMKTAFDVLDPAAFKNIMKKMAKILPDHVLIEKTSISTDGLVMWSKQIKNGYKPLRETFTVPINNAGIKIKLPGSTSVKQWDNLAFTSKEAADAAEMEIKNILINIPNSEVKVIKQVSNPPWPVPPGKPLPPGTLPPVSVTTYTLKVTLPKLQSTKKSLEYLNILPVPAAKAIYNKDSK